MLGRKWGVLPNHQSTVPYQTLLSRKVLHYCTFGLYITQCLGNWLYFRQTFLIDFPQWLEFHLSFEVFLVPSGLQVDFVLFWSSLSLSFSNFCRHKYIAIIQLVQVTWLIRRIKLDSLPDISLVRSNPPTPILANDVVWSRVQIWLTLIRKDATFLKSSFPDFFPFAAIHLHKQQPNKTANERFSELLVDGFLSVVPFSSSKFSFFSLDSPVCASFPHRLKIFTWTSH